MAGEALERVLKALTDNSRTWREYGGKYSAQCPAHDDHDPSMTVSNGDGLVLMTCHAGCDFNDILDALGLTKADLRDGDQPRDTRNPLREFLYQSPSGRAIGFVQRHATTPNGKRPFYPLTRSDGRWEQKSSPELKNTPYRLPQLLAAVDRGDPVWVVEGERDADTLAKLGIAATCNAGGSGKWTGEHAYWLKNAHITICRDRDPAGSKHADKVIATLAGVATSLRLVEPAEGCKDITDHITAGHEVTAVTELTIGEDPPTDALSLTDLYQPIDWHALWNSTTDEPDWLCPGLLERGRLHAIYAPRKHKKSLLTLVIVAELISGHTLLGRPNPHSRKLKVLYIDIENAQDDIRQRLQAAGYGPNDLDNLIYMSFPSLPGLDTITGGQHLLALVEHYHPDLVVLDTTSRVVTGKENDADTFRALYRHALAPIKATGTAILRLDHAGKDATMEQRGSSAKGDDLDTAWLITMPSYDRLTLRLAFQRTNHHPQEIDLVQYTDPLRFVRIDVAHDRPEISAVIVALDRLGVPADAGRETCRKALTGAGVKINNEALSEALKIRKARLGQTSTSRSDLSADHGDRSSKGSPQTSDSAGQTCPGQTITETINERSTTPVRDLDQGHTVTAGQTCPGQVADSADRSSWPEEGELSARPPYEVAGGAGQRLRAADQDHHPQDDDLDPHGVGWLLAHLSTTPQTIARLATDISATHATIETALSLLESTGQAECHTRPGLPDVWSLLIRKKNQ